MNKTKYQDVLLAQGLLESLVELNKNTPELLWEGHTGGTNGRIKTEHDADVLTIVRVLGLRHFEDFLDLRGTQPEGPGSMWIKDFRYSSFQTFVKITQYRIDKEFGLDAEQDVKVPDYEAAYEAMNAWAELLNYKRQLEYSERNDDGSIEVTLGRTSRMFVLKFTALAELQNGITNTLWTRGENQGVNTPLYAIARTIAVDTLCKDLEMVEEFIRAMCGKLSKEDAEGKFQFDLEPIRYLSIAGLIKYEAERYKKSIEAMTEK